MRNIREINPIKIGTILGYECYIPDSYYNPLGFLKKNCPVWIRVNSNDDCKLMYLGEANAYVEIADYIRRELQKRKGYYCVKPTNAHHLSCRILNQDDKDCAEILLDEHLVVTSIVLGNDDENDWLQGYFLMDYNIKGYESAIVRIPKEFYDKAKQLFNVLINNDGYYIQLG